MLNLPPFRIADAVEPASTCSKLSLVPADEPLAVGGSGLPFLLSFKDGFLRGGSFGPPESGGEIVLNKISIWEETIRVSEAEANAGPTSLVPSSPVRSTTEDGLDICQM